jgi:hypothetical protein
MWRTRIGLLVLLVARAASATPLDLTYDSPNESKTVSTALSASTPIRLEGRLAGTGAIDNTLTFVAGSSALSLSATWLVAPPTNRTIGVNIDLFDATNTLVASDIFIGTDGTLATSRLAATNLVAGGLYHLQFTGTAVGFGRFQIDLANGTVPPPIPAVAAAIPDVNAALFDTHSGTKTFPTKLTPGDDFRIEGKLQDDGGAIKDVFEFTTTSTTALSAGIEWIVGTLADPQRTIGVNVDIFDAVHNLIISDTFVGITDGQAFSQFALSTLPIGKYTLEFTGTTPNALGRYRIDLSTSSTAPGFAPIDDAVSVVPEPDMLALTALGMTALVVVRGRRREASPPRFSTTVTAAA